MGSTNSATTGTAPAAAVAPVTLQRDLTDDQQQAQLVTKVLQQQQQQQEAADLQLDLGSDDPESDRELQAEFHESQCCQDVLDIVADELNRFSPHHTVTAINR